MIKLEMEVVKEGDVYMASIWFDNRSFAGISQLRSEAMDRAFNKVKEYKLRKVEIIEIVVDDSFNIQENGTN